MKRQATGVYPHLSIYCVCDIFPGGTIPRRIFFIGIDHFNSKSNVVSIGSTQGRLTPPSQSQIFRPMGACRPQL